MTVRLTSRITVEPPSAARSDGRQQQGGAMEEASTSEFMLDNKMRLMEDKYI